MPTKTDIVNSYNVQFVFDYTVITTTVFAMHPDAAPDMAADFICTDLGIPSELLNEAQNIIVDLIDEDVL